MSVRTMARVWELSQQSGSHLLMLLAVADFSDDAGFCYPGIDTLAVKCRTTYRNAIRLLDALVASGELEIRKGFGPPVKGGRLNLYRVRLEALEAQKGVSPTSPLSGVEESKEVTPTPLLSVIQESKEVTSRVERGDIQSTQVVTPVSPKPSGNHQKEPSVLSDTSRRSRIPSDWQPDDKLMAWAQQKRPDLNLAEVVERFRDHWIAKGEARASWEASFRNWVRLEKMGSGQRRGRETDFGMTNYGGHGGAIPA